MPLQKEKNNLIKELPKKIEIGTVTKLDSSENQAKLVYLAIGSNLGNKIQNIDKAKLELKTHNIKILKCSNNFGSESWPDPSKPEFVNIMIKVEVYCSALRLLEICKIIEKKLGRTKSKKNSPRKCDIDIIDYDKKILNLENRLIIPHPRMVDRNFVLLPLYQIDKTWKHPISRKSIVKLINTLKIKDLKSIKEI